MEKIIIGFSKSKKKMPIASWAIRAYQCTSFSHVYIRVAAKKAGRSDHILHASEGVVQHMSGTQFDKKHAVVEEFEIQLTKPQLMDLKTKMHELAGANYSIMQNIGIIWVHFLRVFGIRTKNPWKDGWNCSEYVAYILSSLYRQFQGLDYNMVTPKDLYNILKTNKI